VARIYTRAGDSKTTGIQGGIRLTKHSFRIEAIGSIDELNASMGFLISLNELRRGKKASRGLKRILERIQRDLFVIGSDLSYTLIKNHTIPHPLRRHYPKDGRLKIAKVPKITSEDVHRIENLIDQLQARLPPLHNFILPQGNPMGAYAQVTRTVCRRAERRAVQLAMHSKINPMILAYLNRLSDLLFFLARGLNRKGHKSEIVWKYNPLHDR
jgi:cob(I)alamin adenosyltransferase